MRCLSAEIASSSGRLAAIQEKLRTAKQDAAEKERKARLVFEAKFTEAVVRATMFLT